MTREDGRGSRDAAPVLRTDDLSKSFGSVSVLRDVNLSVEPGQIHGLVGHNGAGKSTLVRLVQGVEAPTSGGIEIDGRAVDFRRPDDARAAGVRMVFQELSLIPDLSVADNIFLHTENSRFGIIRGTVQQKEARSLLERIGAGHIPASARVRDLGIAEQQMVEVAKALRSDSRLLILDEPTGSLSRSEINELYKIMRRAASDGIGIIFITHHLNEIFEICNAVTVLRDGEVVLQSDTRSTSLDALVEALVGGELSSRDGHVRAGRPDLESVALQVTGLTVGAKLKNIDLSLHPNEVVGIAGLAGSGRSTFLKALIGEVKRADGELRVHGSTASLKNPASALRDRVAYIPENRKTHGLVLEHSVLDNTVLSSLAAFANYGFFRGRAAEYATKELVRRLETKTRGVHQAVAELSGGNQQKVVLGKALLTSPRIMLLDEPTRGVDIRAAAKITAAVLGEVDSGASAVWVSSDLDELIAVCDRVLILRDGELHYWAARGSSQFTQRELLSALQRPILTDEGEPGP